MRQGSIEIDARRIPLVHEADKGAECLQGRFAALAAGVL